MSELLEEQDDPLMSVPRDLACRLSDWHISMWDPVYAVSSSGLAGSQVHRSRFMAAYEGMVSRRDDPDRSEYHEECVEICAQMASELGIVNKEDIEHTIVSSMSRIVWTMAWTSQAEEEGVQFYPQAQLEHIAPSTPRKCYDACLEVMREACKSQGYALSDFIAAHKPEDMNLYDFGYEVAMASTGSGGGDITFRTKDGGWYDWHLETYYFDFKDEWESPDGEDFDGDDDDE